MSPIISMVIIIVLLIAIVGVSLVIKTELDQRSLHKQTKEQHVTSKEKEIEAEASFYFSRPPKSITLSTLENEIIFQTTEVDSEAEHVAVLKIPYDPKTLHSELKLAVVWDKQEGYNFFQLEFYAYKPKIGLHSPSDIFEDITLKW